MRSKAFLDPSRFEQYDCALTHSCNVMSTIHRLTLNRNVQGMCEWESMSIPREESLESPAFFCILTLLTSVRKH